MNNSLQNPLQVLKARSREIWSGCIEIEEPKDASVSWQVYVLEGKIQYITTTEGQQTRLNYLWQTFKLGSNCPKLAEEDIPEYTQLCQWLSNRQLGDADIKKLLFKFVQEGLTHILSINQTNIQLIPTKRITKAIVSFDLEKLKSEDQIRAWEQVRTYLGSPFSRLYLEQKNALQFYKIWKVLYNNPELAFLVESHKLSSFVSLFVAKNPLYEIATKTKFNIYLLAKYLKQSLTKDIIDILPFKELSASKSVQEKNTVITSNSQDISKQAFKSNDNSETLIVCIDDSKTVQRQVKMTLEAAGYQVLTITEPTMAFKAISQLEPAVIFMDINMPDINGYDLCSLLRRSQKFKEVPIVMLTGRDGMIDRVRAKLVGATDYLTKPCDPNKLISLTKVLEKSIVASQ